MKTKFLLIALLFQQGLFLFPRFFWCRYVQVRTLHLMNIFRFDSK
jgi:hypothetical protein